MNKQKRIELIRASALIAQAQEIIKSVKDEEMEKHDNLPENFQYGKQKKCIDMLDETYSMCDDLMSMIDEI